jgi:hypothetical protein
VADPDPKRSWVEALAWVVCAEADSHDREEIGFAWFLILIVSLIPATPMVLFSTPWQIAVAITWGAVVYVVWWRALTAPRMPTIWEAVVGYLLFLLMPLYGVPRLVMRWLSEAKEHESP